jgi:hypothetical protein
VRLALQASSQEQLPQRQFWMAPVLQQAWPGSSQEQLPRRQLWTAPVLAPMPQQAWQDWPLEQLMRQPSAQLLRWQLLAWMRPLPPMPEY